MQVEAAESLLLPLALRQLEDHHGSCLRLLEGLSIELQRHRPSEWNQSCMVLLRCIEVARREVLQNLWRLHLVVLATLQRPTSRETPTVA